MSIRICANCNNQITSQYMLYCWHCGSKLVSEGFTQEVQAAIEMLVSPQNRRGRKSVRAKRIYEVLKGREEDLISLSEYAISFEGKTKDPRGRAAAAINVINALWSETNVRLEFVGEVHYRLRRK